ncbi:FAD-dependent oxidoreductase [Pseudoflavonifractor phocaeensis]|uniref:FAD-dependent oxidoreductase n=1 Tax=Pseudoflavonifractor phocaeensis TaxID=1870988 RepID=UPI001F240A3A
MFLPINWHCDVLVVGSGIAGLMAAIEAAEAGCAATLMTSVKLFYGSSFYPGTWGLGLIGPEDRADQADLVSTIQEVGCGMASQEMAETFVDGIQPAIEKVRAMGVRLRQAVQKDQREFIPCFDHKGRDWNGIEFDSARQVFGKRLEELGVQILERCEVLQLVRSEGRVCGAVVCRQNELHYLGCRALVLATGGYGSLFRYHLCTEDVAGMGQALALEAGCSLVNMEFMQMMPGYISPAPKTIFNEKTFRFVHIRRNDGGELLPPGAETDRLLDLRSGHGPFTSRLDSREVDLALFRAFLEDERGVEVTYSDALRKAPPEFITTYFDWLREAKGLTMDDPIHIGVFAHAANGGVRIDPEAFTGVPGLFACGEVTGGMHGADRIGGLSTANGLVFGGKAGRSAAASCLGTPQPPEQCAFEGHSCTDPAGTLRALQQLMFQNAMIARSETGLNGALERLDALEAGLNRRPSADPRAIAGEREITARLTTARCVLQAALLRRESRGSHYREDFPHQDPALERQIILRKENGITARFSDALP